MRSLQGLSIDLFEKASWEAFSFHRVLHFFLFERKKKRVLFLCKTRKK